jgi:hypothetical protein
LKNQADMKKLADFEKSGGHEKTSRILKNQADKKKLRGF